MSSFIDQAKAEATQDIEILGWWFRLRRITSRELSAWRAYLLLLLNPDQDIARLATEIKALVAQGDDLTGSLPGILRDGRAALVERASDPEVARKGEETRGAILAAGVVAWGRVEAEDGRVAWRPVRVVPDGDAVEGDGERRPDVVPVRMLPGGGSTEEALSTAILTMSQAGEAETRRLARFRRGPGVD